jgi:cytochrome b
MLYVWSWFVRIAHWTLVAAFAVAFMNSNSIWELGIHSMAGYTAGAVMIARIIWGITAHGYCNFSRFPFNPREGLRYVWDTLTGRAKRFIGHNPAGSLVIYGMLTVGLLTVSSGILVINDAYLPVSPDYLQDFHGVMAWSWLALVVTHISGVLLESLLHKENLIATMITGLKRRRLEHLNNKTENAR